MSGELHARDFPLPDRSGRGGQTSRRDSTGGGPVGDRVDRGYVEPCHGVSAGCDHCYAMTLAKRLKAMGSEKYQNDGDPRTSGPGFGVTMHPQTLDEPYRWRQPRIVFINSMADLFHAKVTLSFI